MATECTQGSFWFSRQSGRDVVARFDGGSITSDGGGLLLGEMERRTGILRQFAACFRDHRDPEQVEHTVQELVSQRVYGLALGYEDLNDHDRLRTDPLLAAACGNPDLLGEGRRNETDKGKPLAGKSTLNRLELGAAESKGKYRKINADPAAIAALLLAEGVAAIPRKSRVIVLDFDATDDPLHGNQEGRFYHGYYRNYCYLPLYCFCGDIPLWAELRKSDIDASLGTTLAIANATLPQFRRVIPLMEQAAAWGQQDAVRRQIIQGANDWIAVQEAIIKRGR